MPIILLSKSHDSPSSLQDAHELAAWANDYDWRKIPYLIFHIGVLIIRKGFGYMILLI